MQCIIVQSVIKIKLMNLKQTKKLWILFFWYLNLVNAIYLEWSWFSSFAGILFFFFFFFFSAWFGILFFRFSSSSFSRCTLFLLWFLFLFRFLFFLLNWFWWFWCWTSIAAGALCFSNSIMFKILTSSKQIIILPLLTNLLETISVCKKKCSFMPGIGNKVLKPFTVISFAMILY